MKLQGRRLRVNMRGEDVERLQQELLLIGYEIQDADGHYGKGTRQAVQELQEQHDLEPSGIVDENTAQHINKALEREFPEVTRDAEATFRVEGQVVDGGDRPIFDLQVRAFGKRLRRETFLGESVTDEEGHYAIHYLLPGVLGGSKSVNLLVRVSNHVGNLLSESRVIFEAKSTAKINFKVPPEALRLISDFVKLSAQLLPHLGGTSLSEINDEDIHYLAHAGSLDPEQVQMLAQSAQITEQTNLSSAVLYGLLRGGFDIDPEKLVKISDRDLRRKIAGAVEENVIPVLSPDELDDVLHNVKVMKREHAEALARRRIAKSARLQIRDENSGAPLAGHIVYLHKEGRNPDNESHGYVITDHEGMCAVGYTLPAQAGDEQQLPDTHILKLDIRSPKNESIHQGEVRVATSGKDIKDVLVPIPEISRPEVSIDELEQAVQLDMPEDVRAQLRDLGINTVSDIREAGKLGDLPVFAHFANHPSVRSLEAHAQLNVLSPDSRVTKSLIQAGYTSLADVADNAPERLHADIGEIATEGQVISLHKKALVQTRMLDNLGTRMLADHANGHESEFQDEDASLTNCSCPDCEAAVSPLAYLAELLRYAVKNLRKKSKAVTLQDLSKLLYQPLAELPASCRDMDKKVAQVRLCIEVLRRYLLSKGIALPQPGISHYLEQTYRVLLSNHGINYDALRTALGSDDKTKASLADRNGLPHPGLLDQLIIEKNKFSEDKLETLFGLISTAPDRHPLSDGPVSGSRADEIVRWNLGGVEWNRNTDENGEIFVRFVRTQQGLNILLFKARGGAGENLVASGEVENAQETVELKPENNSGLSGRIVVDYIANGSDVLQIPPGRNNERRTSGRIVLSCLPRLLGWRLAHLRQGWKIADWPENSDNKKVKARPFIDPDLIGPEHIRTELSINPAWQIWQERHETLADSLEELRKKLTDAQPLYRFNGLLKEYLADNRGVNLLQDWEGKRNKGESIEDDLTEHHLSAGAFNYLLRLKELVSAANPQVHDDEWEELYAILIMVQKRRLFPDWCEEEKNKKLILAPEFFVIPEKNFGFLQTSQAEKLPAWRAARTDLLDWEDCLQARIDQQQSLITAFYAGVVQTEEQTLPGLRDSLLLAVTAADGDLKDKGKWVTKNLLIDAITSTCEKTTRVSLATNTLQVLLGGVRDGLFNDAHPNLSLDAPDFDEEWKWMGNYATWRAAVFVFLYPENILLPALRRHQTPVFIQLAKKLQKSRRLTPEQACIEAQTYSQYFQDVCDLELEASCYASTRIYEGECRNRRELDTRTLFYTFARARKSNTLYMSVYDPTEENLGYAQSFWAEVPGVSSVLNIVGAQPYDIPGGGRYIYLFVRATDVDEQQLQFVKYDLEAQRWIDTAEPLDLPPETTHFTAVVKQTHDANRPPHVIIRSRDGAIYARSLALDGTEWAEIKDDTSEEDTVAEWPLLIPSRRGSAFNKLIAVVDIELRSYGVVVEGNEGKVHYRVFGELDDGKWRKACDNECIGAFSMPTESRIYIVSRIGSPSDSISQLAEIKSFHIKQPVIEYMGGSYQSLVDRKESWFHSFNEWLKEVSGVSLKDIKIPEYYKRSLTDHRVKHVLRVSSQSNILWEVLVYPYYVYDPAGLTPGYTILINDLLGMLQKDEIDSDPAWSYADSLCRRFFKPGRSIVQIIKDELSSDINNNFYLARSFESARAEKSSFPQNIKTLVPCTGSLRQFLHQPQLFAFQIGGLMAGPYRLYVHWRGDMQTFHTRPVSFIPLAPILVLPLPLTQEVSRKGLQARHHVIAWQYISSLILGARSNLTYLEEAYYFVPMEIARRLQARGHYTSALDWYRNVYDYTVPENSQKEQRKIFFPLVLEENINGGYAWYQDWLQDPLNPHAIAETRPNTYTRFTILAITRCLLDYADAEFIQDTAESISKARTLYMTALEVLDAGELQQSMDSCSNLIAELAIEVDYALPKIWRNKWRQIQHTSLQSNKLAFVRRITEDVRDAVKINRNIENVLLEAEQQASAAATRQDDMPFQKVLSRDEEERKANHTLLLRNGELADNIERLVSNTVVSPFVPPVYTFCVSPNPVLKELSLRAENSLFKLRTCRNIAGMKREVEPYSDSTDQVSGLPQIGAGGQIVLSGTDNIRPTPYRFAVLIDRAKQLASQAQQMEAAMLSAIEKRDAESYNYLKARQDLALTRATVRLQKLRLGEAKSGVKLAELQKTRSEIAALHYEDLLDEGMLEKEHLSLALLLTSSAIYGFASLAALANKLGLERAQALGFAAQATQSMSSYLAQLSSYERMEQDWQFQKALSEHDILLGDQQIQIAEDRVGIMEQEGIIAGLQKDHAKDTVEFLHNKFTNVELYDWMADTLEGVYSFFIAEASAIARLAENQLTFERQEPPPAFIQSDYWEVPSEEIAIAGTGKAPDRRGLTGSARLLQDIYQLDQYAFETDKIQKPLSETFSLAQMMPAEFQRFRETGIIQFATPLELYDRKFPGHYLRLIKKVTTSVIALVPPIEGIHATLLTNGTSRVVIGGDVFQTVVAHRDPEWVALTSPREATGAFELQAQPEKILPFEGMGVDTSWELRMPKAANQFDYNTIADVFFTIDYTAQYSWDYYSQVIQSLRPTLSASRAFSFHHELADAWYDLHNPDQSSEPMVVRFPINQSHFPPNLDRIRIEHVVLYFSLKDDVTDELEVALTFIPAESGDAQNSLGGEATSLNGMINTRFSSSNALRNLHGKEPFGSWTLDLAVNNQLDTNTKLFADKNIEDVLLVITYKGTISPWPQ